MIAIREVYGQALKNLAQDNPRIVVLEADVGGSTRTAIFGQVFPERYFNVGIAEINMASMAAGFASSGLIPFVNTFASFMTSRAGDPIQSLGAYDRLNIKYVGTYCGMSDAYDGASHHALSDIAFLRALPNMTILCPCDEVETRKAVEAAVAYEGPVYLRLNRDAAPNLYGEGMPFEIGKANIVRNGQDVTIIATGLQVHEALKAAAELAAEGIDARVVDMHTILPIDREMIVRCAKETGAIVTAEEHSVRGGLGSAVAEVLVQEYPVKMQMVGMREFAESGPYTALQKKYHVDASAIAESCRTVLK